MQSQKLKFTYRHCCQLPEGAVGGRRHLSGSVRSDLLRGLDVSLGEISAAD